MRLRALTDDGGFSLVETVAAISIVLIVVTPGTAMMLKSMGGTHLQQQRQAAAVLADQTLEFARAVAPARLRDGRSTTAVTAQLSAPTKADFSMGDPLELNNTSDGGTYSSAAPVLPLTDSTQSVANSAYTIRSFVARCYRPVDTTSDCTATAVSGSTEMYRVTVSVQWVSNFGGCDLPDSRCEVLTSTLVEPGTADPVFTP